MINVLKYQKNEGNYSTFLKVLKVKSKRNISDNSFTFKKYGYSSETV